MLTLHRLELGYRLLYTAVLLFMTAGTFAHGVHQAARSGLSPGSIAEWYRGNADRPNAAFLSFPKALPEVVDDSWTGITTYALAFLVFGGILARSAAAATLRAGLLCGFAIAAVAAAAAPPLIRYASAAWAILDSVALAVLPALGLAMSGLAIHEMWFRRSAGPRFDPIRVAAGTLLIVGSVAVVARPLAAAPCGPGGLTTGEALREVFPGATRVAVRRWTPDAAARSRIAEESGGEPSDTAYAVHLLYDAEGSFVGYGVVTEHRGKYRPITFLVGITPELRVKEVAVMVYREDRGGEVQERRFLVQYRGKTLSDPIRVRRDIVNITGATISVRAISTGVREVLAVAATAFASGAPPLPADAVPVESIP